VNRQQTNQPAASCSPARTDALSTRIGELSRAALGVLVLAPVLAGIYYAAYWLRFEGKLPAVEWRGLCGSIGWVVLLKLAVFRFFRLRQLWGGSVSFYDLTALVRACIAGTLLMVLVDWCILPPPVIPRSVFLIDWGMTIVVLGGIRCLLRVAREGSWRWLRSNEHVRAVIVGANTTGEWVQRTIIRNGSLTYHVVGFLDDDPARQGTRVAGVPVLGPISQTCRLAERHGVREVLIVQDELSSRQLRRLMDEARRQSLAVRVLPSYEQLITGKLTVQPRPVAIEDLLRRDPVALDLDSIRKWIDGQVLLVTGSAGSIGSEICRQLVRFSPRRVLLVDRAETGQFFLERELLREGASLPIKVCLADVLDEHRLKNILREHRPQIVFHAAAYKHVPLMEEHPGEAVKNIIAATRRLADLAAENRVKSFVMISTDKAVNPTSVMGACKRVAELYVQSLAGRSPCRFVTVRFGNVLDSAGSVVQIFRQQISQGGPVTVTDARMKRYFMTIPEAARLVIQAGTIAHDGEILTLDMGKPVRILDLAADMIRLSGLEVDKDIAIEITGLRPGEKLSEELRVPGEENLPTCHPSIIVVDHRPADGQSLLTAIEELERLAVLAPERITAALQAIVPEYRPAAAEYVRRAAA